MSIKIGDIFKVKSNCHLVGLSLDKKENKNICHDECFEIINLSVDLTQEAPLFIVKHNNDFILFTEIMIINSCVKIKESQLQSN